MTSCCRRAADGMALVGRIGAVGVVDDAPRAYAPPSTDDAGARPCSCIAAPDAGRLRLSTITTLALPLPLPLPADGDSSDVTPRCGLPAASAPAGPRDAGGVATMRGGRCCGV